MEIPPISPAQGPQGSDPYQDFLAAWTNACNLMNKMQSDIASTVTMDKWDAGTEWNEVIYYPGYSGTDASNLAAAITKLKNLVDSPNSRLPPAVGDRFQKFLASYQKCMSTVETASANISGDNWAAFAKDASIAALAAQNLLNGVPMG